MSTSKRLHNLLKKGNKCHWCGCDVVDYQFKFLPKKHTPSDMATVDHVRSKFHPKRAAKNRTVLACYECNKRRASEEHKLLKPTGKFEIVDGKKVYEFLGEVRFEETEEIQEA